jgi:hypothetical protein
MLASQENWKDVQKYFQGTFVKFTSEGEKIWLITKVTDTVILAKDRNGEEVCVELARPFMLDYVLPHKAVYQFGEHAAVLQRLPQRMWKKGLSNENTELLSCSAQGSWQPMQFSAETLEGFVNKPGYFSFIDAENQFKNGESLQSVALSPRISLTRKGGVFIDTVLVGRCNKSGLVVKKTFFNDVAPLFPISMIKKAL